jgi:hypothetical protein
VRVRFQADVDLNEDIVAATLRERPQILFRRAAESQLHGLHDPEVLAVAAAQGAILVTSDQATMPSHFATFIQANDSPGVLVVPQKYAVAPIAASPVLVWEASTAEEWRNVLLYLPF